MAKNVWLKDYKIGIAKPKALTAKEAKMVAVTISRGLWNTENSVIRNDASVLRHDLVDDLVEVTELTDDLRSRVVDIVKRFNRLREEDLNKTLLDDSSLPMGGNNSDGATSTASEEAVVALSNKINAFERRLDRYGLVETTDSNGNPVPKPGSWADFVSQPRATTDSFDMRLFALCVFIGAVLGIVVGFIATAANNGPFGPIGGFFVGSASGAAVGVYLGGRHPDRPRATSNMTTTTELPAAA